LSNQGRPFNPLVRKQGTDTSAALEKRTPGGLGLLFIRKCMDDVSYQRHDRQNILMAGQKKSAE
jgi:anti-sigma regulatory factor (Ser/Thr protein kinase)